MSPTCDLYHGRETQFAFFSHAHFTKFPRPHAACSWLWPALGGRRRRRCLLHEESRTITLSEMLFNQCKIAALSWIHLPAAAEEQRAGAPDVQSTCCICYMLNYQLSVMASRSPRALWLPLPSLWKLSTLWNTHTHTHTYTLTHAHTTTVSLLRPVLSVLMKAVTSVWWWEWSANMGVCVCLFVCLIQELPLLLINMQMDL